MTLSITFYDNIKYGRLDFINRDLDFFGNGVVALTDFPLTFPSTPNMTFQMGQGRAWVDGYRIANDSNLVTLTVAAASSQPRIDIVQIGHDDVNKTYSLMVKQGVPAASNPVEPGADPGYIKLYAIAVGANVTSITSGNITDRRSLVPLNVTGSQISYSGVVAADGSIPMTGPLTLPGDPTQPLQASTKQYADKTAQSSMSRQAVINGNFDVWQRGNGSYFNAPLNTYWADRWKIGALNADGGTLPGRSMSQIALSPGELSNSYYFARLATDGAGTSLGVNSEFGNDQLIENGTRYLCGASKKVTVSFFARCNLVGKKLGVCLFQFYGTGGTPSPMETLNGSNWTLTSTWTKYSFTFTTNTLSGKTFGTNNDDFLILRFYTMWGSNIAARIGASSGETFGGNGNVDIGQVQLSAGDVALPFQPRSFAEELALCQRYYWTSYGSGGDFSTSTGTISAIAVSSSVIIGNVRFTSEMRIAPSLKLWNNGVLNQVRNSANGTTVAVLGASSVRVTKKGLLGIQSTGTPFTVGQVYDFDYEADAEL